ncbi:MAG: hypothetical protein QF486_06925 [Candidatus Woesearchaeota archaeon]|jgi:hypothetical protein|nr:hypothetical protein [Candidatus Woesearchaeota archaeon]MDP7182180.1 hypothetical protein [Candidatus Woesearchaeota archaeon]MDP7199317.1 hypothetical protein [Candidatus Woesearchaeota archaeon]MDP7467948.1 hypothetical protein [Candidatus Woesearchaeota archaeon]MDP7647572.1 hypothetical protein [Candidatus Woesearchaeota archaeon]
MSKDLSKGDRWITVGVVSVALAAIIAALTVKSPAPAPPPKPRQPVAQEVPSTFSPPTSVSLVPAYDFECHVVLKPKGFYRRNDEDDIVRRVEDFYKQQGIALDVQLHESMATVPKDRNTKNQFVLQELNSQEAYDKIIVPAKEKLTQQYNELAKAYDRIEKMGKGKESSAYYDAIHAVTRRMVEIRAQLGDLEDYNYRLAHTTEGGANVETGTGYLLDPTILQLREIHANISDLFSISAGKKTSNWAEREGALVVAHETGHFLRLIHTFEDDELANTVNGVTNFMSYENATLNHPVGFVAAPKQVRQLQDYKKAHGMR